MSVESGFDIPHLYMILAMSGSSIVETLIIEGYNINDPHYYMLENYANLASKYPHIHQIVSNLIDIYKKQCKTDPNINNLKNLFDISNEFGQNFIKIIECEQKNSINACSYYQNNKKTLQLKPNLCKNDTQSTSKIDIKIKTMNDDHLINPITPIPSAISTNIATTIKPKIAIKMKK